MIPKYDKFDLTNIIGQKYKYFLKIQSIVFYFLFYVSLYTPIYFSINLKMKNTFFKKQLL